MYPRCGDYLPAEAGSHKQKRAPSQPPATQPPTTNNQLPTTDHQLPTTDHQLPTKSREQQRRDLGQITTPHVPGVRALGDLEGVRDAAPLKQSCELFHRVEQRVLGPASDPEQRYATVHAPRIREQRLE